MILIIRINKAIVKQSIEAEIGIMDTELNKITALLKGNKGRMTQKELRKHFPMSEAKISLMIAELESMGKIKKIKKGRGNIIILNKKK